MSASIIHPVVVLPGLNDHAQTLHLIKKTGDEKGIPVFILENTPGIQSKGIDAYADYLAKQFISLQKDQPQYSKWVLHGYSLGGATAPLLLEKFFQNAAVTQDPIPDARDIISGVVIQNAPLNGLEILNTRFLSKIFGPLFSKSGAGKKTQLYTDLFPKSKILQKSQNQIIRFAKNKLPITLAYSKTDQKSTLSNFVLKGGASDGIISVYSQLGGEMYPRLEEYPSVQFTSNNHAHRLVPSNFFLGLYRYPYEQFVTGGAHAHELTLPFKYATKNQREYAHEV